MEQRPEGLSLCDTEYWLTNRVFRQHRGQLTNLARFLREIVFQADSPYYCPSVKAMKNLSLFSGDLKTLLSKIIMLARDGNAEMAEEIIRALERTGRLLPGEKQEWENETYTLLLLDPEKTLLMVKAILEKTASAYELDRYFKESNGSRYLYLDTHRLSQSFPSIRYFFEYNTLWKRGKSEYETRTVDPSFVLKSAFLYEVISDFYPYLPSDNRPILLCADQSQLNLGDFWLSYNDKPDNSPTCFWWHMNRDREIRRFTKSFLILIKGKREKVLRHFPRPLQDRIASWEFDVPNRYEHYQWRIGLHPSQEHASWKKRFPMFVPKGKGISRNMGAIFFPEISTKEGISVYGEAMHEYVVYTHDWYEKECLPFRVLFQPYYY